MYMCSVHVCVCVCVHVCVMALILCLLVLVLKEVNLSGPMGTSCLNADFRMCLWMASPFGMGDSLCVGAADHTKLGPTALSCLDRW